MRRRQFLGALGYATTWSLAARAQQATPVIGFLGATSLDHYAHVVDAYRQGLGEAGYVDGRNVTIEFRWAEDRYERLPALAAELLRRRVAVITAASLPAAVVAKAATDSIPIVFSIGVDPVEFGLVSSMNRPGGNITGVANLNLDLVAKQLEVLHELVPAATVAAVLVNRANPNARMQASVARAAADSLGLKLDVLYASTESDLDAVIAALRQSHVGGVVIGSDSFFVSRAAELGALTARQGIAGVYQFREFAVAGGLLSYGSSITDAYRKVGAYTGRVLKGEKPAELPVQQSTRVELIVNLKAAKALGITVPQTLLARADEVIE